MSFVSEFSDHQRTAAAGVSMTQESLADRTTEDQPQMNSLLGIISTLLDPRRWIALAIALYFCWMNVVVVPVACLCTLAIFLPIKLFSMALFNRLEHELCRLVNDSWMSAGRYCGLNIVEYGDDINGIADKRALCLANHLGLLDHFCLMTSFHDKGTLAGKYMWVIFNIWKWNPVGAMWTAHGNFFVHGSGIGEEKRRQLLKQFRRHLQKNYWRYNYGWVVMYPEGSRLFLIKKSEKKFCLNNKLEPFVHTTHPRVGAAHSVLQVCVPKPESVRKNDKATKHSLEYVVDCTLGYHQGVVPHFGRCMLGLWPSEDSMTVAVHYRVHKVKQEWVDNTEVFRSWLYEQYKLKEQMLDHFYKTGKFPSNPADRKSLPLVGRPVNVSDLRCLLVQIVWMALFYFHVNMWFRPLFNALYALLSNL